MPSKGERQRQAILDALARLLETRPIGELTVGEIADAAGVRRSGYYFYFDSKYSALAVATAAAWSEVMQRANSFVRSDHESPADFLTRTASAGVAAWREHAAILVASIQAIPLDDQLAKMWGDWNERLAAILTTQLVADRESGVARPASGDIRGLVANLLEMTIHLFYEDRLNKRDEGQTSRLLAVIRSIWLASAWGIVGAPESKGA
jgi:AcrR family transcriptional regulator